MPPNSSKNDTPLKPTLGQFIEENSKLVTGIAAFIALAAFSSQIDDDFIKLSFSGLAFLAAVLLSFELLMKFPAEAGADHWRLKAFWAVLVTLVATMGWYWFSKFPALWAPLLGLSVLMAVYVVVAAVLTHLLTKAIKLIAAQIVKSEIKANVMVRVSRVVFLLCAALVFVGLLWTLGKLSTHPIKVRIPVGQQSDSPQMAAPDYY